MPFRAYALIIFQSPLPVRGATDLQRGFDNQSVIFQSPLPVRGATERTGDFSRVYAISIPAPRKGSDLCQRIAYHLTIDFNPRSP